MRVLTGVCAHRAPLGDAVKQSVGDELGHVRREAKAVERYKSDDTTDEMAMTTRDACYAFSQAVQFRRAKMCAQMLEREHGACK
eukprot:6192087-Pleurochrysis_carterae.AAC.1